MTTPRLLVPDWRPGPGQKYADAPHAVCVVTALRGQHYYWTYADDTVDSYRVNHRGVFCDDIANFPWDAVL